MKYLITGLGNIGEQYANTRHNIGFIVLDYFSRVSNFTFEDKRYGFIGNKSYRGRAIHLLKPSTYVNLSGNAINYWLKKLKIPIENLLVVVDDLALPFGTLRLRKKGGDGGHNGLFSIIQVLGTENFARLRFGISDDFNKGGQVNYVLGEWSDEEVKVLPQKIEKSIEIIKSFCFHGIDYAMNMYNKK
ncbi:MAG: aminoacyl-tRNA hydrolase [Bacteroidales bacterium]|nr:aminoacyl-tRNA hydrolase [Bacteroidales bacterium]